MGLKWRRRLEQTFIYIFLFGLLGALSLPPLWVALTAIKPPEITFSIPPVWLFVPTAESFLAVFARAFFFNYLFNSLAIAFVAAFVDLLLGGFAAYSISRFKTGGRPMIFLVLAFDTFPTYVLGVPFFILFSRLGMMDNVISIMIADTIAGLPFAIWLLIAFFDEIPVEVEEAALIDGCSRYGAMWHVALPLAQPGLVVVAILTFMGAWNNFFFPLVLATQYAKTMTLVASEFITDYQVQWGGMAAITTILMLPPVLVVVALQRRLIKGLTLGGLKG